MSADPSLLLGPEASLFLRQPAWPIALALAAFAVNGLWLGRRHPRAAGLLATALMGAAAAWCAGLAIALFLLHPTEPLIQTWFSWATFSESFHVALGTYLDPISAMMLAVVFIIAFAVHLYSLWYMAGDPSRGRFFALLPFFVFAMSGLVAAPNLLQLFIFWELVGVSSYLLISFWYEKPSALAAGKKAFILTRFADSFFLLGIVLVASSLGGLDFTLLNSIGAAMTLDQAVTIGPWTFNALALGTLCIFAGGWGKSALFPLHIWLPDAMEGPTPVSSIIHSATMVVAGVFLAARLFPLFAAAGITLEVAAVVGATTAVLAALAACTQMDIKRILAFSTLSQIGYMMLSLGVARHADGTVSALGYSASMFHIFTHAFFKCLLFLGAGVVIHAVHSNLLGDMGGLRRKLPATYACLLIATLAIAGLFPLAGYFSKEEILLACWEGGHRWIFAAALGTAALTAFYMGRFFLLIFHGRPRSHADHAHESPLAIVPMALLALGSVAAGFLGKGLFMHQVVPPGIDTGAHHALAWLPWASTLATLLGLGAAAFAYTRPGLDPAPLLRLESKPGWYRFIQQQARTNEAWLFLARRVAMGAVAGVMAWFDRQVVDRLVNAAAQATQLGGFAVRMVQNGQLAFYVAIYVIGLLIIWFLSGGGHL